MCFSKGFEISSPHQALEIPGSLGIDDGQSSSGAYIYHHLPMIPLTEQTKDLKVQ